MRDHLPVAEIVEIAASPRPLLDRARALVESLDRWLPVDAVWLTLSDPAAHAYATVGSSGLEQPVLDYLTRPSVAPETRLAGLDRPRRPVSVTELPVPVGELPTWADCLIPAGFAEGLDVPLRDEDGTYVGMLSLLFSGARPPSPTLRGELARAAPLIARGISPMRSLLATSRLVDGATSGVVLLRDGTTFGLPGLDDHTPPVDDPTVIETARRSLLAGQVYRSFLWPHADGADPSGHASVTVLAAHDAPAFVLGVVLVRTEGDCGGLTRRELQVLGLLVEGHSNQQIARRLAITLRTVATHVEHILHKLDVPSRTMAAVHAERVGWHVPPVATLAQRAGAG